ncbi:MAG: sigma-70 family RNA polymerase sigma factor [Patescibacteria group bacterium]
MLEDEYKIIKRAQRGDQEYFGQLYDHYTPQIYRFVFFKVGHQQEAEDLTHEIFLNAWKNIDNFTYRGHPFSSWLYQIARNRIIDYYRAKKDTISLDDVKEIIPETGNSIEERLDIGYDMEKIKMAMRQLNGDQQNVIILRFIEELSPAEIAKAMDKSEGAVRLIQHRAIKNLRVILNTSEESYE